MKIDFLKRRSFTMHEEQNIQAKQTKQAEQAKQTRQLEQIEKIISIEWEMFQNVDSIGGRASCQDDFETFYIMRRGQYENWTPEMLCCYLDFAEKCQEEGRNLVTEKYARMMQYTDLHYYNKYLAPHLPALPHCNYPLINAIVEAQIRWETQFAAAYPKLSQAGRPITSDGDVSGFTSMETYSRGELETYPQSLLQLYADYVKDLQAAGKSLSMMIQQSVVTLYGYDSIEEAEASL
jgi:hypothetical protein